MNILSQFKNILEKNLKENFSEFLINITSAFENPYNADSYKHLIEQFDKFTSTLNKEAYTALIMDIDEEFMKSPQRKLMYDSKGYVTKGNFKTMFGDIPFKRRRYVNKEDGSSLMFVDRFLGLAKYSRMDPFVIAELLEESASNSYAKAGRIVAKEIGAKIKYDDDLNKYSISRATARNIVIKAQQLLETPVNDKPNVVDELTIILDEKFVGSQFNDGNDHMIKAAVVYEGTTLEYKNRIRLTGKRVFGNIENGLLTEVMDYIYYNYETDKLKKINIMGDGATWIKSFALDSSFKYHKDIIIKYGLDHFHLSQAIQHIITNKHKDTYKNILMDYVYHNNLKDFITVCESIMELEPTRKDTIRKKLEYIKNNWKHIQTYFHDINYKCCMESNISHVFADIFTSRPKAYSKAGLKALLNIRLLKINGYDLKKLYFIGLKKEDNIIKENVVYDKISSENNINDTLRVELPIISSSSNTGKAISNLINNYSI